MTTLAAVAVVVPAHNEEDLVLACLDALAAARARLALVRPEIATSVTVVLDACHDGTAALVATRPEVTAVEVSRRCVGAARRIGTDVAVGAIAAPSAAIWTAHTDADSCVPPEWLTAMVELAEAGVDAVVGTVTPDADTALPVRAAWSELNPPVAGHEYVHGANLGVRASALREVGGWASLPTGEDVDLVARLRTRSGLVLRSIAVHSVITSSRAVARAPEGFSSYLRDLTVA